MDLTNIETIQQLCKKYAVKPDDSLGQNFLICKDVLDRMVDETDIKKNDTIVEVGPGFGTLTIELAKRAKKIIAVELDKNLIKILKENLKPYTNVEIIHGDILRFDASSLQANSYKLTANLPYGITSHFLKRFLTAQNKPGHMTLMLQKEVAQRICARAGQMSLLSVSVQFFADPKILFTVPKKCFFPEPKVESAVVSISIHDRHVQALPKEVTEKKFFQIARIGFSSRRKQIHNNIANGLHIKNKQVREILQKNDFDPSARAQSFSVEQWITLAEIFSTYL